MAARRLGGAAAAPLHASLDRPMRRHRCRPILVCLGVLTSYLAAVSGGAAQFGQARARRARAQLGGGGRSRLGCKPNSSLCCGLRAEPGAAVELSLSLKPPPLGFRYNASVVYGCGLGARAPVSTKTGYERRRRTRAKAGVDIKRDVIVIVGCSRGSADQGRSCELQDPHSWSPSTS